MKKALSLMLALALCFALAAPALAVDTSGLNANTAKAYYDALAGYNAPLYADLKDMDGNGIPELIVVDKTGVVDIWQIKDERAAKGTSATPDTSMQNMRMQMLTKNGKTYLCASTDWARSGNYFATDTIVGTDGYVEKLTKSGYMGDEADEHAECSRALNGKESKITAAQFSQYYNAYSGWDGVTILTGGGSEWYANDEATANYKTVQTQLAAKMSESAAPAAGTYGKYTIPFEADNPSTITFDAAMVSKSTVKCTYEGENNSRKTSYEERTIITLRPGSRLTITGGYLDGAKRYAGALGGTVKNGEYTFWANTLEPLFTGTVENAFTSSTKAYSIGNYIIVLGKIEGFSDVKSSDFYADAVKWAVDKSIANGTGNNKFSPSNTCTKAQILTFLWRANGSPASSRMNPFKDVSTSDYYYQAALWALEKGLVSGNAFNGSEPCTRGMTVYYLWQLAGKPSSSFANPKYQPYTITGNNWDDSKWTARFDAAVAEKTVVKLCKDSIDEVTGQIIHGGAKDTAVTLISAQIGSKVLVQSPMAIEDVENAIIAQHYSSDDKGVFHSIPLITSVETLTTGTLDGSWGYLIEDTSGVSYFVVARSDNVASFSDVPSSANYAQAVAWAIEKGITNGAGNNQFLPNKTCTRGEIVTFLYRAYGK